MAGTSPAKTSEEGAVLAALDFGAPQQHLSWKFRIGRSDDLGHSPAIFAPSFL